MFDPHKPHPLLAQVPLTVSPYLSMPTAVTLPYTFRSVPSSLPPSVVDEGSKPRYVKSVSGHAAHPDDIISSCRALQEQIISMAQNDQRLISEWEQGIREKDLAEKRRVAPGWLDRDEKILEPTRTNAKKQDLLDDTSANLSAPTMSPNREGEELDRVFGKLGMK